MLVGHGKRPLARQLGDLVAKRGLIAAHLSLEDGRGVLLARVAGAEKPSLAELRNQLAHGDSFGDMPTSRLLQTLRDLIDFVYADMIKGGDGVEV